MAREFGWAYVVGSQASGPKGSVQLAGDETRLNHDPNLIWSDDLNALLVSGNIVAHNFEIQNQTKTVFNFEVSGSSIFGDTPDDLHQFTGSIDTSGTITAHSFMGYGGDLEGVAINHYTNFGDNRLVTSVGEKSVHAEDNLLFDGSLLSVTGNVQAIEVSADQLSGTIGLFDSVDLDDLTANTAEIQTTSTNVFTGSLARVGDIILTGRLIDSSGKILLQSSDSDTGINIGGQTSIQTLSSAGFAGVSTSNVSNSDFAIISNGLSVAANKLYVSDFPSTRVGVGTSNPLKPLHIFGDQGSQVRISSVHNGVFGVPQQFTDLETNLQGKFSISPTSGFVGINNSNPSAALDVVGDAIISGNLTVSGTLRAETTDFVVSADTLTFGDEASDLVVINAQTVNTPNQLNLNNALYVSGTTIGVGDYSNGAKFEIESPANQFKVGTSTEKLSISVNNGSTTLSTETLTLDIGNNTKVLGELVVGSSGDIVLDNVGQISSSVSVSSDAGYFNNLETNSITNGQVSISSNTITAPTLNATSIGGTLTTATQLNVTSLGNLTSLTVNGESDLNGGLNVSDNLAVGISTASRKVEIKDSNAQLRLTNTEEIFGLQDYTYADLNVTNSGDLKLEPSSGKVIIPSLNLTNVTQGSSSNFLSLDSNGNVILSPAVQSGIEVRNRTIVSSSYQVLSSDYFIGIQATENLTITLPDASSLQNGQIMVIKDEDETADIYSITINAKPNQLIENRQALNFVSTGASITIYTDGVSKFFIM